MDCNRSSRSPRLILDESINFNSLSILLPRGLNQRCPGISQIWRAERTRDDQLMKQRENDAIAAGRIQLREALVRIKNGIMKWLAEEAVAQYPCVCRSCIHAKTDDFTAGP